MHKYAAAITKAFAATGHVVHEMRPLDGGRVQVNTDEGLYARTWVARDDGQSQYIHFVDQVGSEVYVERIADLKGELSAEEIEALEAADWNAACESMRRAEGRWEDAGCPTGFGWEHDI